MAHMALCYVEVEAFRDLIQLLNPAIFAFLYKAANLIRRLIIDDYNERKERVREDIRKALSKVHISFDLWTSPNGTLTLCAIVAHYLDQILQAKSLLLGLKEIEGSHSGENITVVCLPVIGDFELEGKIGYFVSDNVGSNDFAVDAFCKELKLKNSTARRLRCLRHVINLAAKAFLFGNEERCFDFDISELRKMKFEERQALELLVF
jgi:hypothetical protein